MYPKIKLDKLHIVPGVAAHRDVKATACPAGLDFDRIIWIARTIIQGGTPVAEFDPINNPAHRQWLDDRYATNATVDTMKKVYNPVAAWAASAPHPPAFTPEVMALLSLPVTPDTNQKGEPPEGHPAHEQRAGIRTPAQKAGKEE